MTPRFAVLAKLLQPGGQEIALDIDADDVEEGDVVSCEECGTEFEVVATEPLQLSQVEDDGYDDEDEDVRDDEEE
jgi:alpha-aminoadipate/glutamate carrier protein LysW